MDKTFEQWKARVDEHIKRKAFGLTSDDLPDYDYYRDYVNNYTPSRSANAAIQWAKSF